VRTEAQRVKRGSSSGPAGSRFIVGIVVVTWRFDGVPLGDGRMAGMGFVHCEGGRFLLPCSIFSFTLTFFGRD